MHNVERQRKSGVGGRGVGIAFMLAVVGCRVEIGDSTDLATRDTDARDTATVGQGVAPTDSSGDTETSGEMDSSTVAEIGSILYTADDPRIRYTGRFDFADPARPELSLAGSSITARFKGVSLAVHMENPKRWDDRRNYYSIFIDGSFFAKIAADWDSSVVRYEIARWSEEREHTVILVKRTECSTGHAFFLGFEIEGEMLPLPPGSERRILTIGDSIASGNMVEAAAGSEACNEEMGHPYHNPSLSFGELVANSFGAEHNLVSHAGIGLYRNASAVLVYRTMPVIFDLIHLDIDTSPVWDHSRFVPDVIVVELGTNDYTMGHEQAEDYPRSSLDPELYAEANIAFVDHLLELHPASHVFLLTSPLLSDGDPDAGETRDSDHETALNMTVEYYESAGVLQVHKVDLSRVPGLACYTHPSPDEHALIADEVRPAISAVMGW